MYIAFLGRGGVKTWEQFEGECKAREMAYEDVWVATYQFLRKEAQGVQAMLGWYPILDEYVGWWGDLFLGKVVGKLLYRWKLRKSFNGNRVLHAVECLRRGWWGIGDELCDRMYNCADWPPLLVDGDCKGLVEYGREAGIPGSAWRELPCLKGNGGQ